MSPVIRVELPYHLRNLANTGREVQVEAFPKIAAVEAACAKLPAFDKARPENQPDAE